jgi:large subunit ribosomal protein L32
MAVPKKRTSKSRQLKRRATIFLTPPALSLCPNCNREKPPHIVCPHCGYYKGEKIIDVVARLEKKEKKKKEKEKIEEK